MIPDPTLYKCPNRACQETFDIKEVEHREDDFGNPVCPECRVDRLGEMLPVVCTNCEGTTFEMLQPDRTTGPDLLVICANCEEEAEADDTGVWW